MEKPEPPRPVAMPTPVEKPEVRGGMASLKIDSRPSGADVFINAEFKGTTPIRIANLPAGPVQVLVSKEGFLRYDENLSLKTGESRVLSSIRLEDLYGEIFINSNPPRAKIFFDGDPISPKTPVTIRKVPRDRPHRIRLQLNGYKPWETSFTLKESGNKKFDAVLQKD